MVALYNSTIFASEDATVLVEVGAGIGIVITSGVAT